MNYSAWGKTCCCTLFDTAQTPLITFGHFSYLESQAEEHSQEAERSIEHDSEVLDLSLEGAQQQSQAVMPRPNRQGEREAWNLEDVEVEIMESNSPEERELDSSASEAQSSHDAASAMYSLIDPEERALLDLLGKLSCIKPIEEFALLCSGMYKTAEWLVSQMLCLALSCLTATC